MPSLHALSLLLILAAAPATAFAQTPLGPPRGPAPSLVFGVRAQGPLQDRLAPVDTLRPMSIGTYAKEGAIAGGLLGAVGVGLLAEVGCGLSEDSTKNCTGSFLIGGVIGAALGALPGALIGGLFPKYPKLVHPDSATGSI
jgi:hypothetical protein